MSKSTEIDGTESILDSRNIDERLEHLENELQELQGYLDEYIEEDNKENMEEYTTLIKEWKKDWGYELENLQNLVNGNSNHSEWKYGLTLINEDYFVEYCKELLIDIGDLPRDIPWYIEIDWEKTAENLKQDYSGTEFMCNTFYYRS
jgi:hypothetical protein